MRGWTPPGSPSLADLHSLTGGLRRPKRRVPRHEVPTAMCPPARFRKDLAISATKVSQPGHAARLRHTHARRHHQPSVSPSRHGRRIRAALTHHADGLGGTSPATVRPGGPPCEPSGTRTTRIYSARPIAPTRRNRRADSGLTTDSTRSICLSDGSRTDTFLRLHRKLRAAVRQPTDAVQARTSRSLRFGCATHQMPHAI